jgi:hypothetical protein
MIANQLNSMIQEGLAASLESIINLMYVTQDETMQLGDQSRGLTFTIQIRCGALMNFTFEYRKDKDHIVSFHTKDFPIFVYHNSIARLTPIYNQLLFLERHPEHATPDLFMSFAATLSNIGLMLGEQSLIKTENQISELIDPQWQQDFVIVCGPIGECMLATVHMVRFVRESTEVENVTFWRQFVPETTFTHLKKEFIANDSVMMRKQWVTQLSVLKQLKALQMLLLAIATNLALDAEERAEGGEGETKLD